eukprot:6212637-Lingulodinium_polyedra.AAC.1
MAAREFSRVRPGQAGRPSPSGGFGLSPAPSRSRPPGFLPWQSSPGRFPSGVARVPPVLGRSSPWHRPGGQASPLG